MNDLLIGLGLVLVFEGLIWALIPSSAINLLEAAKQTPEPMLRAFGLLAVALGVVVVWFVRG